MVRRPRIGITTRLELSTGRYYLDRRYCTAVEASGGIPILIPLIPTTEFVRQMIDCVDGLLLPGSNTDVDPSYYGEEPEPLLGTVIPEKDETDLLALRFAEENALPILAICFGMQVLNVFRGGSLIQDMASGGLTTLKHDQGMPYERNSHSVSIEADSMLSRLDPVRSADGEIRVNSSHHQAIKSVGRDLAAVAWASDGVIEAIEDTRNGRWALGVQWHPEMTFDHDPVSKEIFKVFVEISRNRTA
ncbi:MAG: gamma-glutamyl-gamma-aminobutyrate hydrolase family protein [Acidobacteriota bacterium]|nr:MAG: gamma-glutamyl-gamma-aminobutyrate hydrolase family protein [Acidobacteriota bacterium]